MNGASGTPCSVRVPLERAAASADGAISGLRPKGPGQFKHALSAALLLSFAGSCFAPVQRVPAPMENDAADEALESTVPISPAQLPEGTARIGVIRHADAVELRPPGALDAYPMRFWSKTEEVPAGTEVRTSSGGRVEFVWPGEPSSVVVSDTGAVLLGDPEAGEALLAFQHLTHARLTLTPEDLVLLPGGAELRGDDSGVSGPCLLELASEDVLEVVNQSSGNWLLRYRDVALELAPGDALFVPLLDRGTSPAVVARPERTLARTDVPIGVTGQLETRRGERTVGLRALEQAFVFGLGVRVELQSGDRAIFSSMQRRALPEEAPGGNTPLEPEETSPDPPISLRTPGGERGLRAGSTAAR